MTWRTGMVLLAAALAQACAGGDGVLRRGPGAGEDIRGAGASGEKVTEHDLNRDGKTDVWSYAVAAKDAEGKEVERLVRKELDINWDGRVDIRRHYGADEVIEREVLDLDFDGKVDQVNAYEKGVLLRKERDLNYDGKADQWVFFERGRIARKERDSNFDGKVDYWEYWEADQVDRVGEDLDGDGDVDRWTRNPGPEK